MSSGKDDSYLPPSTARPSLSGHGLTDCREIASENESPNDFEIYKGWYILVETYTNCSSTKKGENLMALA
jgi:hypothetical protein